MNWNIIEKLSCTKSANAIETKSFSEKDLELALFPIQNSSAIRATESSCVNFAKECFSGEVSWQARELDINNIHMATDTRQSGFHQSTQWPLDSGGMIQEHLGKRSSKRNFELVDSSPCQEIIQNKKSCIEYKHSNKMRGCYTNQSTGLTTEVQDLKLSVHRSQQNDCANKENMVTSFDKQQTPEKSPIPMIAKNLMCELDEDCEKNNKDNSNSSFLCSDDDRACKSIHMDSDSSFPGISVMESPLEQQLLDPDKSVKEYSFEESNVEDLLTASPNCQENTLPKGDENTAVQGSNQKMLAPSSSEVLKTFTFSKRNAVAFRSFNSHINVSNNSEPSKMSINLDAMDISCTYSGSYPMAITPTQKGRSYMPCQVCDNFLPLCSLDFRKINCEGQTLASWLDYMMLRISFCFTCGKLWIVGSFNVGKAGSIIILNYNASFIYNYSASSICNYSASFFCNYSASLILTTVPPSYVKILSHINHHIFSLDPRNSVSYKIKIHCVVFLGYI